MALMDLLLRQFNIDRRAPRTRIFNSPDAEIARRVPYQDPQAASFRTINRAVEDFNLAGQPLVIPGGRQGVRDPYNPIGPVQFIDEAVPSVDMRDATQPSPMALEAMGEDAAALLDVRTPGEFGTSGSTPPQTPTPPAQEPGFMSKVGDYFGDPAKMAALAMAANTMRLNPDQALQAVLAKRVEAEATRKKGLKDANKTSAALRAIGTPEAVKAADMIDANPTIAKEIYTQYVKTSMEAPTKSREGESTLRKEFTGQAAVKDFAKQSSAFGRVVASAQDPSAAGDLALIFNYMKVLDPGSTVREGEFATAQNAAGIPGRVQSLYNSIISGERLNPEQRNDFVDRSRRLYDQSAGEYQGLRNKYVGIAQEYGYDVERTVPDFYAQNAKLVRPQISYDELPAETKARFPNAEAWNRWFNSQPYLEQLKLQGAL